MALAYFITFTTYGTWLHGTAKGMGSVDNQHNVYGTPFVEPDPQRERAARASMTQPPYTMAADECAIVCQAIVQLALDRNWTLLAAHVRSNHVHVVVESAGDPDRMMSDMKGRASRDLNRAGFDSAERKRWIRDGCTKHLFTPEAIAEKIDYTLNRQGPRMAIYESPTDDKVPRTK